MKKTICVTAVLLMLVCAVGAAPAAAGEMQPEEKPRSSIFDLMTQQDLNYEVDLASYYLSQMQEAAAKGDVKAGQTAEENRNAYIDEKNTADEKISFDELYLLSKVICFEAGSDWLSNDFRLCVGEVIMNRVASCEFPDTIHEVIYQKGQYSWVSSGEFIGLVPNRDCVDVALRLLQGERQMVPSVVYQSNEEQGEIFSMYTDKRLGTTYFCVSENLDLYD